MRDAAHDLRAPGTISPTVSETSQGRRASHPLMAVRSTHNTPTIRAPVARPPPVDADPVVVVPSGSTCSRVAFAVAGGVRRLALPCMAAMGLWPLLLQVLLVPKSVVGDGHGDRYEQVSYFAMENDHYQVLAPLRIDCSDLQRTLFDGQIPLATTQDLIRAVPEAIYKALRASVVQQTSDDTHSNSISISTDLLRLARDRSVCFGGIDSDGSLAIDALLSTNHTAWFGIDPVCIQGSATHVRLRVTPTEFFDPDTMSELNPVRLPGAVVVASLVDQALSPVLSSCYDTTRQRRYSATRDAYRRLVSVYSSQLLVTEDCSSFARFGGERDAFGCAYSALGAAGAIATLAVGNDANHTYAFPAPWRMIQCTVVGQCSSLLFTQLWLSEWTVETRSATTREKQEVLRNNFVNHKMYEVTVDSTFSLRLVISLQMLALVLTAYVTSVRGWYVVRAATVSPWTGVLHATTCCTVAKVVRSSYNVVLVAQMAMGILQWRHQLTIDMLVGADARQAILRATGCGTLMITLAINILFARAGDLKRQEIEPSVAHVVAFIASLVVYAMTHLRAVEPRARALLLHGLRTIAGDEITQHSACRGSIVCAAQASLQEYSALLACITAFAWAVGIAANALLHRCVYRNDRRLVTPTATSRSHSQYRREATNSFTRFLDDRARDTDLFDGSVQLYVRARGGAVLSTRGHLEACGFVAATTVLFRYRDLPLFLVARVVPTFVLNMFNITVTIHELDDSDETLDGTPVLHVADQIVLAHWSTLKRAKLDWSEVYFGGRDVDQNIAGNAFAVEHQDPKLEDTGTSIRRPCVCGGAGAE